MTWVQCDTLQGSRAASEGEGRQGGTAVVGRAEPVGAPCAVWRFPVVMTDKNNLLAADAEACST